VTITSAAAIAAFALCYAGLSSLCLAMNRHHQQVLKHAPSKRRTGGLRLAGWALLVLSLIGCMAGWGASVGAVVWFGVLAAAALAIVVLLPYAPNAVVGSTISAAAVGLLVLAWLVQQFRSIF
jgi:hypothetical protein